MSQEHEWLQAGYRYAVSLTHHHQDAEDLVQKAWLKIISGRRKIRTRSFLFKTIRNLFIDQIRRANIIQFDSLEEDNREVMVEDSSCASSRSDMEWLLEQLRPEEREALYLQTVEGYTAQEIARLTGKSRNTILSLIRRGKKKLMDEARQESAGPRKEAAS